MDRNYSGFLHGWFGLVWFGLVGWLVVSEGTLYCKHFNELYEKRKCK